MGSASSLCSSSAQISASFDADADVVLKGKLWCETLSRRKAQSKYEADGTLPIGCEEGLLNLRVYLANQLLLREFGEYARKQGCVEPLMCWTDILEYKNISCVTREHQVSMAKHLIQKYIVDPPAVSIPDVPVNAEFRVKILQEVEVAEATDQPLPVDLFDPFQLLCLQSIYTKLFVLYLQTPMFEESINGMKNKYNIVTPADFDYYDLLGEGGFGFVVRVRKKSTGAYYAMKIQTKIGLLDVFADAPRRVVYEKEALVHCQHPFIVNLDYAFQTDTLAFLAMDLGSVETLKDVTGMLGRMSEEKAVFYGAEIALALNHMHELGMIYRDLKPANVLLNASGHVQLVDLGGIIHTGKGNGATKTESRVKTPSPLGSGKTDGLYITTVNFDSRSGSYNNDASQNSIEMGSLHSSGHSPVDKGLGVASAGLTEKEANSLRIDQVRQPACPEGDGSSGTGEKTRSSGHEPGGNTKNSKSSGLLASSYSHNSTGGLGRATSFMGTKGYMAPEVMVMETSSKETSVGYTKAVDYWSLGVLLFTLLHGSMLLQQTHLETYVQAITASANAFRVEYYQDEFRKYLHALIEGSMCPVSCHSILRGLLEVAERKRLGYGRKGFQRLRLHPFFAGINWSHLQLRLVEPPVPPVKVKSNGIPAKHGGSLGENVKNPSATSDTEKPLFPDFAAMMAHPDFVDWRDVAPPTPADQRHFATWDYVCPSVLSAELGIQVDVRKFNKRVKSSPTMEESLEP